MPPVVKPMKKHKRIASLRVAPPKANMVDAEMKEAARMKSVCALEMANLVDQNHQLQETVAEFESGVTTTTQLLADAHKEKEALKRALKEKDFVHFTQLARVTTQVSKS